MQRNVAANGLRNNVIQNQFIQDPPQQVPRHGGVAIDRNPVAHNLAGKLSLGTRFSHQGLSFWDDQVPFMLSLVHELIALSISSCEQLV